MGSQLPIYVPECQQRDAQAYFDEYSTGCYSFQVVYILGCCIRILTDSVEGVIWVRVDSDGFGPGLDSGGLLDPAFGISQPSGYHIMSRFQTLLSMSTCAATTRWRGTWRWASMTRRPTRGCCCRRTLQRRWRRRQGLTLVHVLAETLNPKPL